MVAAKERQEVAVEDRLISFAEGCRRIGISVRTAHRLRGRGEIPEIVQVGGLLKFRASDVSEFIRSGVRVAT